MVSECENGEKPAFASIKSLQLITRPETSLLSPVPDFPLLLLPRLTYNR